jgi:negative regulator of flagellin synthesis FlgM
MPNKISGLSSEPAPVGAGRPANKVRDAVTGSAAPSGAAGTTSGDASGVASGAASGEVYITDSASQLATLEQAVRSLPAVDPVRVAQFRTAIEQGSYTVQPQHVADRLMQLEQALGQLPED